MTPIPSDNSQTAFITEGLHLISARIDAVSERADRNIERLTAKMLEMLERSASMQADIKIILHQVRVNNDLAVAAGKRVGAIELALAGFPSKARVEAIEGQLHDGITKRTMLTNQIKILWTGVTLLFGGACGAYFTKMLTGVSK
jgi:hypothetical protein